MVATAAWMPAGPTHWPVDLRSYHRDLSADSSSTIRQFAKDPWHYYVHRILGQPRERAGHELDLGTAAHIAITQPDKLDEEVVWLPDGVTRRSKKAEPYLAQHPDRPVLEQDDAYRIERMVASVKSNPATACLLEGDWLVEHAVTMTHGESGLPVKVCFDGLHKTGRIRDIKTASNPSRHGYHNFRWAFHEYGYSVQMGLYALVRDAYMPFSTLDPDGDTGVDIIAVGTSEPFAAFRYSVGPMTLECGKVQVDRILGKLAACKQLWEISGDQSVWRHDDFGRTVTLELPHYQLIEGI